MDCPRCQEVLRQAQRLGVEIDYCPRCRGVWLDGGEMEKLMERSREDDIFANGDFASDRSTHRPDTDQTPKRRERKRKRGFFGELLALFD